ncbi:hypothetical protein MBLNU459_g0723t1 [Dothideomycetes sp. NU459]
MANPDIIIGVTFGVLASVIGIAALYLQWLAVRPHIVRDVELGAIRDYGSGEGATAHESLGRSSTQLQADAED